MDPNHLFAYFFSGFPQFYPPALVQPSISQSFSLPNQSESLPKKYHRTWKKNQVEQIFNITTKYCETLGKDFESLSIEDYEKIASGQMQTAEQIMIKMNEIFKSGTLRPGIWSQLEDELLESILKKKLEKWGQIANILNKEIHNGLKIRTGKQCKERWNNYLNPSIDRGPWTEEEDLIALQNYQIHGNKWSIISKSLAHRTESAVKNRIKSMINKIKQDLNTMDNLDTGIAKIIALKKNEIDTKSDLNCSASPRSGVEAKSMSVNKSCSFTEMSAINSSPIKRQE